MTQIQWHKIEAPFLTVINYSGGVQSSTILHLILQGDIPRPKHLLVLNADPGMENSGTYEYLEYMRDLCKLQNIEIHTVPGPNLYNDILALKDGKLTRLDNPSYFVKKPNGKVGRLRQCCTKAYKIIPMNQFLRNYIKDKYGISKYAVLPKQSVHKWVGFAFDEIDRISESQQKYVRFVYPLVELRMKKDDCISYLNSKGLPIPPRSVCNGCFANQLDYYKNMYENRPDDWQQAVNVDEAVRDWNNIGVKNPVYVSNTVTPLKDLPQLEFKLDKQAEADFCSHPGYCFI